MGSRSRSSGERKRSSRSRGSSSSGGGGNKQRNGGSTTTTSSATNGGGGNGNGNNNNNGGLLARHSRRYNSCVDFTFLSQSSNSHKLMRLNAIFERAADKRTGGIREDRLRRLIPPEAVRDRYTYLAYPPTSEGRRRRHRRSRSNSSSSGTRAEDIRIVSRGPFLSMFAHETCSFVNTLAQNEKAERERKLRRMNSGGTSSSSGSSSAGSGRAGQNAAASSGSGTKQQRGSSGGNNSGVGGGRRSSGQGSTSSSSPSSSRGAKANDQKAGDKVGESDAESGGDKKQVLGQREGGEEDSSAVPVVERQLSMPQLGVETQPSFDSYCSKDGGGMSTDDEESSRGWGGREDDSGREGDGSGTLPSPPPETQQVSQGSNRARANTAPSESIDKLFAQQIAAAAAGGDTESEFDKEYDRRDPEDHHHSKDALEDMLSPSSSCCSSVCDDGDEKPEVRTEMLRQAEQRQFFVVEAPTTTTTTADHGIVTAPPQDDGDEEGLVGLSAATDRVDMIRGRSFSSIDDDDDGEIERYHSTKWNNNYKSKNDPQEQQPSRNSWGDSHRGWETAQQQQLSEQQDRRDSYGSYGSHNDSTTERRGSAPRNNHHHHGGGEPRENTIYDASGLAPPVVAGDGGGGSQWAVPPHVLRAAQMEEEGGMSHNSSQSALLYGLSGVGNDDDDDDEDVTGGGELHHLASAHLLDPHGRIMATASGGGETQKLHEGEATTWELSSYSDSSVENMNDDDDGGGSAAAASAAFRGHTRKPSMSWHAGDHMMGHQGQQNHILLAAVQQGQEEEEDMIVGGHHNHQHPHRRSHDGRRVPQDAVTTLPTAAVEQVFSRQQDLPVASDRPSQGPTQAQDGAGEKDSASRVSSGRTLVSSAKEEDSIAGEQGLLYQDRDREGTTPDCCLFPAATSFLKKAFPMIFDRQNNPMVLGQEEGQRSSSLTSGRRRLTQGDVNLPLQFSTSQAINSSVRSNNSTARRKISPSNSSAAGDGGDPFQMQQQHLGYFPNQPSAGAADPLVGRSSSRSKSERKNQRRQSSSRSRAGRRRRSNDSRSSGSASRGENPSTKCGRTTTGDKGSRSGTDHRGSISRGGSSRSLQKRHEGGGGPAYAGMEGGLGQQENNGGGSSGSNFGGNRRRAASQGNVSSGGAGNRRRANSTSNVNNTNNNGGGAMKPHQHCESRFLGTGGGRGDRDSGFSGGPPGTEAPTNYDRHNAHQIGWRDGSGAGSDGHHGAMNYRMQSQPLGVGGYPQQVLSSSNLPSNDYAPLAPLGNNTTRMSVR